MRKISLSNTFHNKELYLTEDQSNRIDILLDTPYDQWTKADKSFEKRIRDKLCGSNDCDCSGYFGLRG